jgi:hypothetical protein
MSYIRDKICGPDLHFTKPRVRRVFLVMLAITLFFAAWHYGIIPSAEIFLKPIAIGIWDMLCSLAAALADFLKYIVSQRN